MYTPLAVKLSNEGMSKIYLGISTNSLLTHPDILNICVFGTKHLNKMLSSCDMSQPLNGTQQKSLVLKTIAMHGKFESSSFRTTTSHYELESDSINWIQKM